MTKVVYQSQGATTWTATRFDLFQTPIVSFSLGSAAGYTPTRNETNVRGSLTFQGGREHIRTKLTNNDHDITISFIVPEGYNDLTVGNLLAYGQVAGKLTPVVAVALSEAVIKRETYDAASPPGFKYPGNRLMITITVRLVEADSETVVVQIEEPDFSSLPMFGNITSVPDAAQNPYDSFVVNRLGDADHAALVIRGEDNQYWTQPFWQNVNSPKYGVMNNLEGDRATWLWGGPYTLPSSAYDRVQGGLGYEEDAEGAQIFGGMPYNG